MRSQLLFVVALLSGAALAQREAPIKLASPADKPSTQLIEMGPITIHGKPEMTNSTGVNADGSVGEAVAVLMQRDLLACIPGNIDRESLERGNGETR